MKQVFTMVHAGDYDDELVNIVVDDDPDEEQQRETKMLSFRSKEPSELRF